MTRPQQVLGRKIVKLRMKRELTQERLAELSEISHRYLQSLEAGQKEPSISVVVRLRKALECAWDDLLEGL